MTEQEIKLECIKIASNKVNVFSSEDIIKEAEKLYRFISEPS